ncbi:MAG TPA: class I SAM-dependent methyltransferase [Gemmatimonadaceae bacterium]|nr:class I SAM-dependent methyltransferase [Gemmatimonadaceae bacterium]
MTVLLAVLAALWFVVAIALAIPLLRQRSARKQRNLFGEWPVRRVTPEVVDPVFQPGPFGPTRETEVAFIGRGPYVVDGGTSDAEAWVLAVLARRSTLMFEFGTCTGKTAYLWARNSPPGARVVTLTLAPDDVSSYQRESSDDASDVQFALRESSHTDFLYSGSPVDGKVEQLFGDSKTFDVSPWEGRCDLVFVDGSHAYSYVVSDSEKALRLVAPGGLVLWHDYAGPRHAPGVYRALNELAGRMPLVRIEGTTLVAYRRPASAKS